MLLKKLATRSFSSLQNQLKTVVRFENQDQTWTWKDLEYHSNAFACGLIEQGFVRGDKLVTWFDRVHVSETVVSQLGALKAGVVLHPVTDHSEQGLLSSLENAKGCIISPNGRVGDLKKSQFL